MVLSVLFSSVMCAITWFEADGVTPKNNPQYLWPSDMVKAIIAIEKVRDPTLKVSVDCPEQ